MSHRHPPCTILNAILLSALCAVLLAPRSAEAVWIWTPKTGKWINPRYAVKDTPEAQYKFAQTFVDKKDYNRARLEFKSLLSHFPQSAWAPDAQLAVGQTYEAESDYYQAFLAYRKVLQTYPSITRVDEIVQREFHIGELFLQGQKRKLFGSAEILPAQEKSVEVFQAIIDDAPYAALGDQAQFKLGESYRAIGQFDDAKKAFEQLLERYPNSPLADRTRYEIAVSAKYAALPAGYDQSATDQALQEFAKFKDAYPQSELGVQVDQEVARLRQQRAQHAFEVAQFYEQQRAIESAKIYYQDVVANYQESPLATQAQARLQALGGVAR